MMLNFIVWVEELTGSFVKLFVHFIFAIALGNERWVKVLSLGNHCVS